MNNSQRFSTMSDLRKKIIPYLACLVYGITFFSCSQDNMDSQVCHTLLPDTVSFQEDIIPIFNSSCSLPDCHSGDQPTGHLNLEDSLAYGQLTKPGSGYINTSKPAHSILYSMLNSLSQPMPPDGKLDPCEIELILNWIEQGAQDN
jgi:hypothetical protein